jgi:hypothetical protein
MLRPRTLSVLAGMVLAGCGTGSDHTAEHGADGGAKADGGGSSDSATDGAPGQDSTTDSQASSGDAGADGASADTGSSIAADSSVVDTGAVVDSQGEPPPPEGGQDGGACGVASGGVAWTASILAASPLTLSDIVVGPTNDVIVADQAGTATYEQHRWDQTGAFVSMHQDSSGMFTGPILTSNLVVDPQNELIYGMILTGMVQGANSAAQITFTKLTPGGTSLFATNVGNVQPTSDGNPTVLVFDSGVDTSGNFHGALAMAGPEDFSPGVYCYGSNGTYLGPSAGTVTALLTASDYEWPDGTGGLTVTLSLTEDTDFGCGTVTVPAGGAIALAGLDGLGGCIWNKLLAIPTAAVKSYDFRIGADGSLLMAIVYAGTINFGGGNLTSTGTSSLALARWGSSGNLEWAKSFGAAGSSFALDSLGGNVNGISVIAVHYTGAVNLGGGTLPSNRDTVVATFDDAGNFRWNDAVTVGAQGTLRAAVGACGVAVATNSTSVDFGTGPLSTMGAAGPTIGVADLGL